MEKTTSFDTIPSAIKYWADTVPEKEVFVFFTENDRDSVVTAKDVYTLSGKFATKLKNAGFNYGDVISNALPNSPERVVTDFGIVMAGCVPSNCQIMTKDGSEFWNMLPFYKSAGVILPWQVGNEAYALFKPFLPSELPDSRVVDVSIPQGPTINRIFCVGRESNSNKGVSFLDELHQSSDEIFIHPDVSPKSIAYIFATSGSTGLGKPTPRTHEQLFRFGGSGNKTPTVICSQRPLGWGGGYPYAFIENSSCMIIQDCFGGKADIDVQQYWDLLEKEGCVSGFMLQEEILPLSDHFRDNPPKYKLDVLVSAGRPMLKNKVCEALDVLTKVMVVAYASTEMGGVAVSIIQKHDDMEDFLAGHIVPNVSLKIVNEKMDEVAPGEQGLILVKSPTVVMSYYNYTPTKPTTTEDGYFISGDRGWLDSQGRLFVSDRNDEAIHHGSIMVYPSWPESVLVKLSQVSQAVVLGIPSETGTKQLCACIILQPGSNLTKDDLRSAYDSHFTNAKDEYFPELDFIEFFSAFPQTSAGKVNKSKVREMVMKMIG